MAKKKKAAVDFRYDTGPARVPWSAVGEPVLEDDVIELVKFLLPPLAGKKRAYEAQLKRAAGEITKLRACSGTAGKLSLSKNIEALEKQAAKILRAKYALFVTNATAGFEIAHKFAGLKPGDEVIVPAITFISTMTYPLSIGAKIVLADVDPRTINIDPEDVARKITPRTKVIVPVHVGGYPADMDPIMRLARKHDIVVLEDAAHAFGGSYKGKMLGTIGHFGAYSFHEVKNITSLGEGGILATNTRFGKDFARSRFLGIDMGRQVKNWLYDVVALPSRSGYFAPPNHSTTEIQAIGLMQQIGRLKGIIAKRKKAATYLNSRFSKVPGIIPPPLGDAKIKPTYHLYLLQIDPEIVGDDAKTLKKKLSARGIVNIPHYAPLYKFSILRQLGYDTKAIEKTCPAAEEMFQRSFTHLPLYDFDSEQLKYLADAVIDSVNEMKAGK